MLNFFFNNIKDILLFINFNLKIIFIFLFIFIIKNSIYSKNNVNFFFNICFFVIISTIFLFYLNVGAFSGFLFLCEIVSLFAVFIVLNKQNIFLYAKKNNKKTKNFICIFTFIIFILCYTFNKQQNVLNFNVFYNELYQQNDFFSINIFIYNNYYNMLLYIIYILIYLSFIIIFIVKNKNKKYSKNNDILNNFFQTNNILFWKNKILINYFKK